MTNLSFSYLLMCLPALPRSPGVILDGAAV